MNHASARDNSPLAVSPDDEIEQIILDNLKTQNDLEYQLGDTLDIKTSIALVVITFLATLSGGLLASPMPLHWHNIQLASILSLAIAGILAVWELFPRTYKVGLAPDQFRRWVQEVRAFYNTKDAPDPETKSIEFIRRKTTEQLGERFSQNSAMNARKSNLATCIFALTMLALILNLATLAGLSTGWRF
jgi:hypothetical protein